MPNNRMMDYMMRDGRNPYGSRGGYVDSRRGRDGYGRDSRDYADSEYDSRNGDRTYSQQDNARYGRDYQYDRQSDMASNDYGDMRDYADYESDMRRDYRGGRDYRSDGHYPMPQGSRYQPVEAMGYFTGYYGGGDQYSSRDYHYGMPQDMRYSFDGNQNKSLSKEELKEWKEKLLENVNDREKEFFKKEIISSKAKNIGAEMKDYNEDELVLVTAMVYTDYCKTLKKYIGSNMDIYVELAKDWLEDKDSKLKGSERLTAYYDYIIKGKK